MTRPIIRCRRGSVSLEFALVGLALVLLLLAIEEYSRMLWVKQALQSTANATARCAALGCCVLRGSSSCAGSASDFALDYLNGLGVSGVASGDITINRSAACVSSLTSSFTQVTIHTTATSLLPALIPAASGGLSGQACYPNSGS